jgi:hypothetical protein
MILVDSSVWIDFLDGVETWQALRLHEGLGRLKFAIGDLILAEVLQGTRNQTHFERTLEYLSDLPLVTIGGADLVVEAARNYQTLRGKGITVRSTIDTLIASRCIQDGLTLLHDDRDFDAFAEHLGLFVFKRD